MNMEFMPNLISKQQRCIAVLAYDGLCTFEFGIVYEVFGLPRPEVGTDWYEFKTVPIETGDLHASGGLTFKVAGKLSDLQDVGMVIVPGWRGIDSPVPQALCEGLRAAHKRGARIVSICSGAFVLAAAGLLAGRRATTHWRFQQELAQRYPDVRVESNLLYVDEGDILTSAGSSAGIDLCLHIVRSDFGARIANSVAKRLVVHGHRQGGQAQFVEHAVPTAYESQRLSSVLDYIRSHLATPLDIERLAKQVGMSRRTFHRRFVALTGVAPVRWLNNERVTRARDLLETSEATLDEIASLVGMNSAETLRYHFHSFFALSPDNYRKRFVG